jgi:hypothetical protein
MTDIQPDDELLFDVETPLGFRVRVTRTYWDLITTIKHPAMMGREKEVETTLSAPAEIRRSQSDPEVFLFYSAERAKRWVCAVARRQNGTGFLITAYPTDAVKEGEKVWPR